MKRRIPTFITFLTTPLSTPILHNLLLTPLRPARRITNILLPNKHDSRQTSEIIRRLPHSQSLIFNLSKRLSILLSPFPTLGSGTNIRMRRKRFIASNILVPAVQGVCFFDVRVDLHHGRGEKGEGSSVEVGDFDSLDGDDGFGWGREFLCLTTPDSHLDGVS